MEETGEIESRKYFLININNRKSVMFFSTLFQRLDVRLTSLMFLKCGYVQHPLLSRAHILSQSDFDTNEGILITMNELLMF